jgi:starch phosphorylase
MSPSIAHARIRTGTSVEEITQALLDQLQYSQGRTPDLATRNDWYIAAALVVRDRLVHRFIRTVEALREGSGKAVAYLSAEFLMGPHLENNLINLGIREQFAEATRGLGVDLDELIEQEEEPGLGNGGLGRLAACYLDSLSTLKIPAVGYGIRYEFGIFDQAIRDGWQVEITDKWLHLGNPWEIHRPEAAVNVKFGGRTEHYRDHTARHRVRWIAGYEVRGEPYDTPVPGYRTNNVNLLRLWSAEAVESFDFSAFNQGDYSGAVEEKMRSETISKVLYPNDETTQGKYLRLAQQVFFVSCSLQDTLRRHTRLGLALEQIPDRVAIQMNDTHPSIAVAELMRLLIDEHDMDWDPAWNITQRTLSYTNHTLLPEALEQWPLEMFQAALPRHMEIIYEINHRFLGDVRARFPGDGARVSRMSIINEQHPRYVRMANLACIGSHAINGVAALHTELLKRDVLHDFYEMYPDRFVNVTNGVTPRRWVVQSNPALTKLLAESIGDDWALHPDQLRGLERYANDAAFQGRWRAVKRANKERLARQILQTTGIDVSPDSLFDIQVKRIHEYKRQHLNALHIAALYFRLKADPNLDIVPRTFIFGGKAAPGYFMAKRMIKLITSIGHVVNSDPDVRGRIKVVYLPDYNVRFGQRVYPAAELSEQISTAGKEASGTGNMKFAMNGALTIGTLDGANIEIREEVGAENFFLFGLTAEQVAAVKASGYRPRAIYESDPELRAVVDHIRDGYFSANDPGLFHPLIDNLLNTDPFLVLADFRAYVECQKRVAAAYRDQGNWARTSILNTARSGKFSSDRSIADYCERIWHASPLPASL